MEAKAKVINRFRDKDSKKVYDGGMYRGSKERVEYLQAKGYLEKPVQKEPTLLDGNVSEVTATITEEMSKEKLEKLLQEEKSDKNRKGVIEHIEGLLAQ